MSRHAPYLSSMKFTAGFIPARNCLHLSSGNPVGNHANDVVMSGAPLEGPSNPGPPTRRAEQVTWNFPKWSFATRPSFAWACNIW